MSVPALSLKLPTPLPGKDGKSNDKKDNSKDNKISARVAAAAAQVNKPKFGPRLPGGKKPFG